MAHLNLLPWRELRRKQLDRQIIYIGVGIAIIAAGLVYLGYQYMNGKIDEQVARNQYLDLEIKKVEKELKEVNQIKKLRADLIARMQVIQRLQSDRTRMVKLFDGLAKNLPKGMYLTQFEIKGNKISLKGSADSNGTISKFMRLIEDSQYFTTPDLNVINIRDNKRGGIRSSNFTMKFDFKKTNEEEEQADQSNKPKSKRGGK
jgi:type IV pilus assembly protein PilN